jgi:hypothetical protein
MRSCSVYLFALAFVASPLFAAGHGGGHGGGGGHDAGMGHAASMGHTTNPSTHGATVSAAAHQAQLSGDKVGPQVRTVAKDNHGHTKTKTHPTNHGADVSQAAHAAHDSGQKVGPQVRDVARSKSKGKTHSSSDDGSTSESDD